MCTEDNELNVEILKELLKIESAECTICEKGEKILEEFEYYDLFTDQQEVEEEKRLQNALNEIKYKYGKNSIFKCMNLMDNATQLERNKLIGGHAE